MSICCLFQRNWNIDFISKEMSLYWTAQRGLRKKKNTLHKVVTGSPRAETYRPLSHSVVFGQAPETEG